MNSSDPEFFFDRRTFIIISASLFVILFGIENLEINSQIYDQLLLLRLPKMYSARRIISLTGVTIISSSIMDSYMQKNA